MLIQLIIGVVDVASGALVHVAATTVEDVGGLGHSLCLLNAGVATLQSRHLPKEDANQINKTGRQTGPRTNTRAKVAKWAVSNPAAARADGSRTSV